MQLYEFSVLAVCCVDTQYCSTTASIQTGSAGGGA
jgi:hypothetical protein